MDVIHKDGIHTLQNWIWIRVKKEKINTVYANIHVYNRIGDYLEFFFLDNFKYKLRIFSVEIIIIELCTSYYHTATWLAL